MTKTVLLVEDDPDICEELAWVIKSCGYDAVTAEHGADALDKLAHMEPPCLIIVDLMMPVMNGWQLRAELLARPKLAAIPVVLLSGVADLEAQARSLDVEAYLGKPLDLGAFRRVMEQVCGTGAS